MDLNVLLIVWLVLYLPFAIASVLANKKTEANSWFHNCFITIASIGLFLVLCGIIEWLIEHITIVW